MPYSQKYCLVHFTSPQQQGGAFQMNEWPLHVTLADVFAIDRETSDIEAKLATLLMEIDPVATIAMHDAVLGTTPVVLLERNSLLTVLHENIIDLLGVNGAVFNAPEFTRGGFLPHCTIQTNERLSIGDKVSIDSVSLVDMFPDSDWRKRRVLATFYTREN